MSDYNIELLHPDHREQFVSAQTLGVTGDALDQIYQVYLLLNQISEEQWNEPDTFAAVQELMA